MFTRRSKGSSSARSAKPIRWMIMANNTGARIYEVSDSKPPYFKLIDQMQHPEGRLHDQELKEGQPGKSFESWRGSHSRHGLSPQVSAHEAESHKFARSIGDYLEKARTKASFDELVVVAEPRFMGVLLANINKATGILVKKKIHKDLLFLKDHELKDLLKFGQDAG